MYPQQVRMGEIIDKIRFSSKGLVRAYNLAAKLHQGQKRKSGEPYFYHCIEVMKILREEWGIKNEAYLVAALLHDVIEDTDLNLELIKNNFGEGVAELVDGVTKLKSSTDKDTLKKVLHKTYLNPGVAVIKLADRLHNMRTLQYMPSEKQKEKSRETLEAYCKLAESLGMWRVKTELEDLAFSYLEPKKYKSIKRETDRDPRRKRVFLSLLLNAVEKLEEGSKIGGKVEIRMGGIYELYKKRERLSLSGRSDPNNFKDINDLISVRIKLGSLKACYDLLYSIHKNMGEMVDFDRFDEFVGANKRINGYEALQTTLNFVQGPVELALVTEKMEERNVWGVVSKIRKGEKEMGQLELKLIFTPSGNIRFLPKQATGVDFALQINKSVLTDAVAMKVDGKKESLFKVLPNAATVEIILGEPKRAPMVGAEKHCLPQTKRVICELRRLQEKDKKVVCGRKIMEKVLAKRGLLAIEDLGDSINPVLYNLGCQGVDDWYFKVGSGSIGLQKVEEALDYSGIEKARLRMTTIKVEGKDQAGILFDIVSLIKQKKKNIKNIYFKNNNKNYELRLLVAGMTTEEEGDIRKSLKSDKRFSKFIVV